VQKCAVHHVRVIDVLADSALVESSIVSPFFSPPVVLSRCAGPDRPFAAASRPEPCGMGQKGESAGAR
jgi:hypothetical protein